MDRTAVVYAAPASVPIVETIIDEDKQLVIPPGFLPVGGVDEIATSLPVLTMRCTPGRLATINDRYVRLLMVSTEHASDGEPLIFRGAHLPRVRIVWAVVDEQTGIATAELVGERDPDISSVYRCFLAGPGVTTEWLDAHGVRRSA